MYNGGIVQYPQHLMLRLSTSSSQREALSEKHLLLKAKEWWDSTFVFLSVTHKWRHAFYFGFSFSITSGHRKHLYTSVIFCFLFQASFLPLKSQENESERWRATKSVSFSLWCLSACQAVQRGLEQIWRAVQLLESGTHWPDPFLSQAQVFSQLLEC